MNTRELLEKEVQNRIEEMEMMEVGSEEYEKAVDAVTKLTDKLNDYDENDIKRDEQKMELQKMEDERKDRLIKNCLTGAGIVTSVGVTIWGTLKTFKFEEEGTITSSIGRSFINKLIPKK